SHLEQVKAAVFAAGGGRIGNYDQCCWQTKGTGQFRGLEGSNPAIGKKGALEKVDEWKVELVLEEQLADAAVKALKAAHPYETPAYHLYRHA
ncbi:MAG: NGG1p interacting factor NIF3, partial [Bdellovibrionota bacterium]